MKNFIIIAVACLALSACKKEKLMDHTYEEYKTACELQYEVKNETPPPGKCEEEANQACVLNGCDGEPYNWSKDPT